MLDAATRPPCGWRPVVENIWPSGCATVFIARPFMTVIRSGHVREIADAGTEDEVRVRSGAPARTS